MSQGYVARMGGEGRYIFYAGYGMNVLKVIDRESMNVRPTVPQPHPFC